MAFIVQRLLPFLDIVSEKAIRLIFLITALCKHQNLLCFDHVYANPYFFFYYQPWNLCLNKQCNLHVEIHCVSVWSAD